MPSSAHRIPGRDSFARSAAAVRSSRQERPHPSQLVAADPKSSKITLVIGRPNKLLGVGDNLTTCPFCQPRDSRGVRPSTRGNKSGPRMIDERSRWWHS